MANLLLERYHYIREVIYNRIISKKLGSVGKGSVIVRPCFLQGDALKEIHIGDNTRILSHCVLECWNKFGNQYFEPTITIGSNCKIGEYSHITACNRITIGDGALVGRFTLITDNSHGSLSLENSNIPPIKRELVSKGEIVIGNNVWLGDKVTICGVVHIGDNVIIGANSVVTKDIPSHSMAAGIPAKVIKQIG